MAGRTCPACGRKARVAGRRIKPHPCGPGRLCNGSGLPPVSASGYAALASARSTAREVASTDPARFRPTAAEASRMRQVGLSAASEGLRLARVASWAAHLAAQGRPQPSGLRLSPPGLGPALTPCPPFFGPHPKE